MDSLDMLKGVMTILGTLLVIHILALLGMLGYGAVSGRFDKEKRQQYIETWKGQKLVPYVEEIIEEVPEESPQAAAARIKDDRIASEIFKQNLQAKMDLLENMQITVESAQSKLEQDILKLRTERDELLEKLELQNSKSTDENFQKALSAYSQMNPKYVKDDLMGMPEDDAVEYLAAMKSSVRTEVLSKFREPVEQAKRVNLIAKLKEYGVIALDKPN